MTDIIEKLEEFDGYTGIYQNLIRKQAIEEIERLRLEVERLKKTAATVSWETDRLRAEGAYNTGRDGWK